MQAADFPRLEAPKSIHRLKIINLNRYQINFEREVAP